MVVGSRNFSLMPTVTALSERLTIAQDPPLASFGEPLLAVHCGACSCDGFLPRLTDREQEHRSHQRDAVGNTGFNIRSSNGSTFLYNGLLMKGETMALGRYAGLFAAAAAIRLFLFVLFPGLPDLLTGRVEISTPVTSFKRCEHLDVQRMEIEAHMLTRVTRAQYRKASFYTTTTSLLTMAVSTTRPPCSCPSSRCSRVRRRIQSLPISCTFLWTC